MASYSRSFKVLLAFVLTAVAVAVWFPVQAVTVVPPKKIVCTGMKMFDNPKNCAILKPQKRKTPQRKGVQNVELQRGKHR